MASVCILPRHHTVVEPHVLTRIYLSTTDASTPLPAFASCTVLPTRRPGSPVGVKVKKVANLKIHDDDANDWARRPTAAEDEDNGDGGIIDGAQVRSFCSPPAWQAVTSHPDPQSVQVEHVPSFGCAPSLSHS